ncbi:unnamed protein product [Adineta ricciae]|uniref:TIR domain-containing protein n=2 Tax=Adineta ricciae TaxID=249248 RepID=A0A814MLP9_ADIRI|nr:unnamed protein product [Adineta ricciae]CAF1351815.1 unnamed protein product [Adineta ricciae]
MDETSSVSSKLIKPHYLSLLEELSKLSELSITVDIAKIDTIFDNVTESIEHILECMPFQKSAMVLITIMNSIVRLCVTDQSSVFISRESFQLMFEKLHKFIMKVFKSEKFSPVCASDILDSIFMNLIADDFIEIFLRRFLFEDNLSTNDSLQQDNKSSQGNMVDLHQILEQYISYSDSSLLKTPIVSVDAFRYHYRPLLLALQKCIDSYLIRTFRQLSARQLQGIEAVLIFILSMTDKLSLLPVLIDLDYIKKSVEWIHSEIFLFHIANLGLLTITIVYNLSRDKVGFKKLRAEKAFDVLMTLKQSIDEINNKELTECFARALIAVSTSDEQSEENKKLILETSETLYKICKQADKDPDLRCDGYHLSEILELLQRAFANTYVIKHIMEDITDGNSLAIDYFAGLFLSFYGTLLDPDPNDLEKRAIQYLLKVLLQISSYPAYLQQLIDNDRFCIIIEALATRPKQDDAKRIWCHIQEITLRDMPKKETASKIYISYHYTDEEICKEFVKELRKKKIAIQIWVDYENVEVSEDMWEAVSPNIRSASTVIVLASTAYGESMDKFQELSYIMSTNKARDPQKGLVVITTEPNFSSKRSWMNNLLKDHTVIPYENNMGHMVSRLYEQIGIAKKSPFSFLGILGKNKRRKRSQSEDSSRSDLNRLSTKTDIKKELLNFNNKLDGTVPKAYSSCSIVNSVITVTGSATSATWV